jgi:hypothetical protein
MVSRFGLAPDSCAEPHRIILASAVDLPEPRQVIAVPGNHPRERGRPSVRKSSSCTKTTSAFARKKAPSDPTRPNVPISPMWRSQMAFVPL